jgi:hypothetical protein
LLALAPGRAQGPTLETVLARAADYVDRFGARLSGVVFEESYEQSETSRSRGLIQTRRIKSDMLFVVDDSVLGGTIVRDVFEIDGRIIPDHQDRLVALFTQPAATARAQALRIADENARFNLGSLLRTTNTPELAVLFLRRNVQRRLTFKLDGTRDDGRLWDVSFEERARPTLIRKERDRDLPASGDVTIEADSGEIRETHLALRPTGGVWTVRTRFAMEPRIGIALPTSMEERLNVDATLLDARATYSRVRLFQVSASDATPVVAPR